MTKAERIAATRKETKERRNSQICKVYELKVDESHLSKTTLATLHRAFLEAKWFWNHILSQSSILNFDTRIRVVQVKTPNGIEDRELKTLGSQIKQELYKKMLNACRLLKKLKSKGMKIGRLKFKSRVVTLPLVQFGSTHKFKDNHIRIQGIGKWFRVSGLNQIPKEAEFANASFMKKPTGYYLKVTTWLPTQDRKKTGQAIGIDLGIKSQVTLSNGIELKFKTPVPKNIRKIQRRMFRSYLMNGRKHTQNWKKLHHRLEVAFERERRKKDDIRNKLCSRLLRDFDYVALQNDSIKSWHSGRYGRQIQESAIGGITARLKKSPATLIVDRFYPSTKLCRNCGAINEMPLVRFVLGKPQHFTQFGKFFERRLLPLILDLLQIAHGKHNSPSKFLPRDPLVLTKLSK